MDWFWNWGVECFGYRVDDKLFAYHGVQVGRFDGEEVYGQTDVTSGRLFPTIASSHTVERKAIGSQDSVPYAEALTRGMQTMLVMRCMQDTKIFHHRMNLSDLFPAGVCPQNGPRVR